MEREDEWSLPINLQGVQSSYASLFCVARVSEILGGCERVITEGWSEEGIVVEVWVVVLVLVLVSPWFDLCSGVFWIRYGRRCRFGL